jgi:polyphosphate kinase
MAKKQNLSVYDNRELSWLKFNQRVLEEAYDEKVPLMEQLTFESIFSSNLDEFFMVRVGSLIDSMLFNDKKKDGKTKMRPSEQLAKIYSRVRELVKIKDEACAKTDEALALTGIKRLGIKQLTKKQSEFLEKYYAYEIKPFINAFVIDKHHPFPFLEGKNIYAALKLTLKSGITLGLISCTDKFERVIFLPSQLGEIEYILAEDVILHFAAQHFAGYKIEEKTLIRVTRSADINIDESRDDEMDYRESMTELISRRRRLCPVRLQISKNVSDFFLGMLTDRLEIEKNQVFLEKSPLDMKYVFAVADKASGRAELFYDELSPRRSPAVKPDIPMQEQIAANDILLSYPYESIEPFLRLLKESAEDENTVSIKMTLYRVAKNSKVVNALCTAAEKGKQVLVCVELRARFDEENNIAWSKTLEEAGCRVMYGPHDLKVHSKLCLITGKIGGKISHITQIGTGNYNEKTAELYTDFSLMTANEEIAQDAEAVFSALSTGTLVEETSHLLVSPRCLQNRVLDMMEQEINVSLAGGDGYVGAKMNSLTDKKIIDKLIECSQAGVKVELVIRGISCLVAGIPGMTDNIRIVSIVGRYLEHSRIYIFGKGARRRVYISSADYMTRNTCRRVEVAAPLLNEAIRTRVTDYFRTQMNDNVKARRQLPDGTYVYVRNDSALTDSQRQFYTQAYALEPQEKPQAAQNAEKKKTGLFARIRAWLKRKKT